MNYIEQMDLVSEAVGLGKLSDELELRCEYCTHDTPCKFHYLDQLKANLSCK